MTDPWAIIGWLILIALTLFGMWFVYERLLPWASVVAYRHRMYRRTRNDAPKAGDRWVQGEATLLIDSIHSSGRIVIRCNNAMWSDSPEEWRTRVRERRLYRERSAS